MRLLVISCQALFAQALQHTLRGHGFTLVETCDGGNADAVLRGLENEMPDIALLDLDRRQGGEAIPIIEGLANRGIIVIGLVPTSDRYLLAETLEAGMTSVFDKAQPVEHLIELLRDAAEGVVCFSRADRDELMHLLDSRRAAVRARSELFDQLTRRESQVLSLLIAGKSAEEIAVLRFVALATVRSQIRGILGKLGVNSQLAAVAIARDAGWDGRKGTIDLRSSNDTLPADSRG